MALLDSEKELILKDYEVWSGGFTPDLDDRHKIYIEFAMPDFLISKTREVLEFLGTYASPEMEK